MSDQQNLNLDTFEFSTPKPIKGYPELHWRGKRPFKSAQFYPAQLKENHGQPVNDWMNEIYWGDNLQVMSHLLKKYRGQIQLIYIDPPFDSKADYKLKVSLKNNSTENDHSVFEEKQYSDIWISDEYLQFMYERLIILRELLSTNGSIFLHCDWHKSHFLRVILDEVFGPTNFRNEIVWKRRGGKTSPDAKVFESVADTILWYSKTNNYVYNELFSKSDTEDYIKSKFVYEDDNGRKYRLSPLNAPFPRPNLQYEYKGYKPHPNGWSVKKEVLEQYDSKGLLHFPTNKSGRVQRKQYLDSWKGKAVQSVWFDIKVINSQAKERQNYPTQKPEELIERIILATTQKDDLILDSFMGSGTTQAVALKLGRRFIGADINLGAIQITTKRLLNVAAELKTKATSQAKMDFDEEDPTTYYTGFSVYNVNNYDIFRNPVQAKELLIQALEIQPLPASTLYDGEKDGRMVKIMPVNRIATRSDLNDLITGFDYKAFEKRYAANPNQPVERLLIVCMGHEPDLKARLEEQLKPYAIDIDIVDILRDKSKLEFKRDAEADIQRENGHIIIKQFYPMNLLQKLSLMKENVDNWRELVESVMIDFYYDGAVFEPTLVDIPDKKELVKGQYPVPDDAGTIRVKITDLLSESLEIDI